jgi:hypothetical protein
MAFSFRISGFGFPRTQYGKTENAGFSRGAGLPSGRAGLNDDVDHGAFAFDLEILIRTAEGRRKAGGKT